MEETTVEFSVEDPRDRSEILKKGIIKDKVLVSYKPEFSEDYVVITKYMVEEVGTRRYFVVFPARINRRI